MKKIYIKPETTVVALNVRDNVMINVSGGGGDNIASGGGGTKDITGPVEVDAREVIKTRDAWEEW